MKKQYLTANEVAEIMSVTRETVWRWLRTGKLQGVKMGDSKTSRWRVDKRDLPAYMRKEKGEK